MKLKQKTAVVTGGGTGIGLGIARAFAAEGCRVAIAGRRLQTLRDAAESWKGRPTINYHTVDVADRDSVGQLFRWAAERLGPIDILVNSAGVNVTNRSMADMTPAEWDRVLAINATGTYNCIHEVLPEMRRRRSGLVINISSIAGRRALPMAGAAYCASKFAQAALGTFVGQEEAAHGIRVTNIYPGEVDTPILQERPKPISEEHRAGILQVEDFAEIVVAIAALPPRANVSELVIKPTQQALA